MLTAVNSLIEHLTHDDLYTLQHIRSLLTIGNEFANESAYVAIGLRGVMSFDNRNSRFHTFCLESQNANSGVNRHINSRHVNLSLSA